MTTERSLTVAPESGGLTKAGLDRTGAQLELLENFVKDVLQKNRDYGVIPGTGGKPTLLKPGAANITAAFNCHAEPLIDSQVLDHQGGFVSYEAHVDLVSNLSGQVMARGFGNCNSYEGKYRYRNAKAKCPTCGEEAVIKGKVEYGGGWLCFRKAGGCGAKWPDDAQEIQGQVVGKVENENPLEHANTIKKMAIKRAEVDAAMRLPGVARFFTQDLEDMAPRGSAPAQPAPDEEDVDEALAQHAAEQARKAPPAQAAPSTGAGAPAAKKDGPFTF